MSRPDPKDFQAELDRRIGAIEREAREFPARRKLPVTDTITLALLTVFCFVFIQFAKGG